ncbi:MAG: selenoprotein [Nitrosomonadales bacterium]|nr:selenoprotein [Nitrosomonadales bacterium]|tara:strand:- start:391 stop:678 length:288 start_codon:yes stop_codon:yes gene_type:complete
MKKHIIKINFCTKCGWLTRASWLSQEFINTFESDISSINLVPDRNGKFEIRCSNVMIFSRKKEGKFIDLKLMKQRIRDVVNPSMTLGHSDVRSKD